MDWYALDEANKKDGHYRRKPLEISSLEVELESAVAAFNAASDRHESNPFQCPSGHFLIQTAFFSLPPGAQKTPAGRLFLQIPTHYTHFWASMPSFLPSHPSKQPVFAPPGAAGAMLRTPPPRKPIFWQNQGGGAQIPPAAAK